jgi:hypothetical protein
VADLFGNSNIAGYVLLVALAALIILRFAAGRRRDERARERRRPATPHAADRKRGHEGADDDEPAKDMTFAKARIQFYVIALAAVAVVIGYLLRR